MPTFRCRQQSFSLSPSATNQKYTKQKFKITFRLVANDAQRGGTFAQYAVKTMGGKIFAIIYNHTAYGPKRG